MSKRKVGIIISASALLLAGVLAWALLSGYITVSVGKAGEEKITQPLVCTNQDVQRFNKATDISATDEGRDEASIKGLAAEITARDGYEADPTCQTILFWDANYRRDIEGASKAYSALKKLHADNRFANTNLRLIQPLDQYEAFVNYLDLPSSTGAN